MATGTAEQIEKYQESKLSLYAPRGEVREAMERFKAGLAIKDATEHEYAALAHVSIAHGLDPFNGEAWIIPAKGVTVGIKGLRKLANRQAKESEFRWWTEFHDIRSAEERDKYNIPASAKAAIICHLRRSDHIEAYATALKALREKGDLPYEIIVELLGRPPFVVGIGYVDAGESSKMPLPQLVRKRAEAHAIKQTFDVPFLSEGDMQDGRVVDDEWLQDQQVLSVAVIGRPGEDAQSAVVEGFIVGGIGSDEPDDDENASNETSTQPNGTPEDGSVELDKILGKGGVFKRPLNADSVKRTLGIKVSKSDLAGLCTPKQAGWIASLMTRAFKDSATADKDRYAVMSWLFDREVTSTRDLSAKEASAVIDWLADETQDLGQDGAMEIQNVYVEAMKALGQTSMFVPDAAKASA